MKYRLIQGGISQDTRGHIRFVNDFNMEEIKRFYIIRNADDVIQRGWRGHRVEQRWFYVLTGSFTMSLVKIDNWENPSHDLVIETITLDANRQEILYVPPGYATAFKAISSKSEVLVFADYPLDHAKFDDFTFHLKHFTNIL